MRREYILVNVGVTADKKRGEKLRQRERKYDVARAGHPLEAVSMSVYACALTLMLDDALPGINAGIASHQRIHAEHSAQSESVVVG